MQRFLQSGGIWKDSPVSSASSEGGAISTPLTDQTVAESQEAVFECEVANPESEGEWLRDGKHLALSDSFRSESDGHKRRLVIAAAKLDDAGEYTYKVATSKTSAKLKVEGQWSRDRLTFPPATALAAATVKVKPASI